MNGNGCAGSMARGVSTGNTRSMNHASNQILSSSDSALGLAQHDPGLTHLCQQFGPDALLVGHQCSAPNGDFRQLLGRRAAVGRGMREPGLCLTNQPGNADRIELVQVRRADRQEPQAFQQRVAGIFRLLQHAMVEVEPGEFAVDEALGTEVRAGLGSRRWLEHNRCGRVGVRCHAISPVFACTLTQSGERGRGVHGQLCQLSRRQHSGSTARAGYISEPAPATIGSLMTPACPALDWRRTASERLSFEGG